MTPIPSLTASSASASPTRTLSSSDSTTQGPAMRNGLLSAANRWAMELARRFGAYVQLLVIERRAHESGEQRMRAHRTGLQLGMELTADEPGMIGQLDHFDQRAIRRQPRAAHAVLGEHVAIRVRDLVAMAMPLAHFGRVVRLRHARAGAQAAGIGAQPHRAAH